ncbi:MAG: ABC transporter substrate-binding protein [Armatimonadetes bacterium]|nr:ABC transporter substrate-binding protein [Armatimonadota bacterium]
MTRTLAILAVTLILAGCSKMSDTPRKSNEYVWLTRYDVKTLDPAAIQDWTTGKVLSYVYPSIGQLCEDMGQDKPTVYYLKVKDAKFGNGDPVTADDIRFTLERCLLPENQSGLGNQFASEIIGSEDFTNGKSEHLQGVKLQPDGSVVIQLSHIDASFINKLKNTAFGVVNHKTVALRKPITDTNPGYGAGNWTFESVETGREWKLKQTKTGQILRFRFAGDSANRLNLFDTNQADYAMFAAHEAGVVGKHANLDKGGPTTLVYLQFNPKTKPELTKELRYQVGSIVHANTDFAKVLGGVVTPASNFLALSGTDPLPSSGISNPKIVSKAHFEITYAEIGMQNPSVEAVVTTLRSAGMDVQGRAMPSGAMLEKNAKGEIPILFTGWQPDFDGPLNTIPMLFHSKSSENHSGYNNPQVDLLIEEAQRGIDTTKNIQKAYALIEQDTPGVPLYIQRDLVLKRSDPPAP